MKTCPKCSEQVQDGAKVCRYCQHRFGFDVRQIGCLGSAVIFILVLVVLAQFERPEEAPVPVAFAAAKVRGCDDLLRDAQRDGIIRRRPAANRIDVEDRTWAGLPADLKRGFLLSVACSAYRRPLSPGQYAVAYGYRSGRRLAMATAAGVTFSD